MLRTAGPSSLTHCSGCAHSLYPSDRFAPPHAGVGGAEAGTLSFMVGGTQEDFDAAKTVLELMGKNIFHCGKVGSGEVVKICNNLMLGISMMGASETMQLGVKYVFLLLFARFACFTPTHPLIYSHTHTHTHTHHSLSWTMLRADMSVVACVIMGLRWLRRAACVRTIVTWSCVRSPLHSRVAEWVWTPSCSPTSST
jgi:hypothetical protein